MLIFILPGTHSQLSESTLSSVQRVFPDARPIVIPSEERAAWVMNEALSVEMFPWFMTLYAGDNVQPHAKIDLERWL
ncbi:glycosyltransferase family 2 protein, partial [Paenibacillus glucanolyticus]